MTASRRTSERGAMLIQVAISILMLMGFTVFVFDNGLLWVSRGQAQNSADAGALAGAVARAYDDGDNPPAAGGMVEVAATSAAAQNLVWRQPGTFAVSYDCPPGVTGGGCVQVDVFRDGTNGSATLPVVFGQLLSITSQRVRATATGQAISSNAAQCLKPWAVADKWLERNGAWTQNSVYQPAQGDVYIPPSAPANYGTGFSNRDNNGDPVDWGMQLALKIGNSGRPMSPGTMSAGWSMALNMPNASQPDYRNNISGCTTVTVGIAASAQQCLTVDPVRGCIDTLTGAQVGQATQVGIPTLMGRDANAYWDRNARSGRGGVVSAQEMSARIVPIAVFDTALYVSRGYNGTNGIIKVVNFLGFFVEGFCRDNFYKESYLGCSPNRADVVGRLVTFPGTLIPGAEAGPAAFGVVIRLVR